MQTQKAFDKVKNVFLTFPQELFTGKVPVNKELLTGTVPVNKDLLAGTVPVNKELLTGRVPVNNLFLTYNIYFYLVLDMPGTSTVCRAGYGL